MKFKQIKKRKNDIDYGTTRKRGTQWERRKEKLKGKLIY